MWDSNKELGGGLTEDNNQLLEHEHSFCPHEHHSHQCEIVDQNWYKHTASIGTCSVNTTHKDYQHAEECYTELDMKYGGIPFTKFPV